MGNCSAPAAEREYFNQPVFQTVQMFVAEMAVVLIVLFNQWNSKRTAKYDLYQEIPETSADSSETASTSGSASGSASEVASTVVDGGKAGGGVVMSKLSGKRILLLALPSTCDIIGTTLMNVGLLVVPVSIFQMVRGAIVLFVGSFSVIFLKRKLTRKQWMGLSSVTAGVFVVGMSAIGGSSAAGDDSGDATGASSSSSSTTWEAAFGVLIILLAQVFTATQFVLEEFILENYSMDPIKVVAWEGTFGTVITVVVSLFVYTVFITKGPDTHSIFDMSEGTSQVLNNGPLLISSIAIMIALATFNVTGLTITRVISATSRSTIDTCRTIGIWAVSLLIGWETFQFLQLVGFAMLVFGTLVFNGVILGDEETKKRVDELLPNEFEHT